MLDKPFSQACENNKRPILTELKQAFAKSQRVLEIGSGTGQHAQFFAQNLAHLDWFTSDQPEYHAGIASWLRESQRANLHYPVAFTVGRDAWPTGNFDAVYTANTTHIMQPKEAQQMMQMVAENLPKSGVFCQYGPFKFNGDYTSESNREFDQSLLAQGFGGIRDVDELISWAPSLNVMNRISLPANNFLLVWTKP